MHKVNFAYALRCIYTCTIDMTAAIQYILTVAQSLGSQVYYKRSRMTILGLAGVLLCENEQA